MVLTLADSVTDTSGVSLDGEWTNPLSITDTGTSVFPSGDGTAGGDFEFFLAILPGDFNQSNIVNITDFGIMQPNFNIAGQFGYQDGDANGDGLVNITDFGIWQPYVHTTDFTNWPAQQTASSDSGTSISSLLVARDSVFAAMAMSQEQGRGEGPFRRLGSPFAA